MRDKMRQKFLERNGFGAIDCPLLAGDASFRKYYRFEKDAHSYVVMDAPPDKEDVKPFIKIADFLHSQGFSAPKILARDETDGFLLLEDLGDDTYTRLLDQGADAQPLYELATDVLIALHQKTHQLPDNLPVYDEALLMKEVRLFTDYWVPAALGEDFLTSEKRTRFEKAWQAPFRALQKRKPTLVLRDYHVDNMLYLPNRDQIAQCGLLDFQDAVAGSPFYDLVSLLEDARRDLDPGLVEKMKQRYLHAFADQDLKDFDAHFAILGAQRHAKVIGIFVRLCLRDNKPDYLHHIPRVWRLFERALQHPALSEVKSWIEQHVEKEKRGIPSCLIPLSNRE